MIITMLLVCNLFGLFAVGVIALGASSQAEKLMKRMNEHIRKEEEEK